MHVKLKLPVRYPSQADTQIRSLEEYFATTYTFRNYQPSNGIKVLRVDKFLQKQALCNLEHLRPIQEGKCSEHLFIKRMNILTPTKIKRTKNQPFKLRTFSCTISSLHCPYLFPFAVDQ